MFLVMFVWFMVFCDFYTDCTIGFFCLFAVVSGLCLALTAHEPTTSLHGTAPPPVPFALD